MSEDPTEDPTQEDAPSESPETRPEAGEPKAGEGFFAANRGPVIIAGAVVIAAIIIVVGIALLGGGGDEAEAEADAQQGHDVSGSLTLSADEDGTIVGDAVSDPKVGDSCEGYGGY